MVLRGYALRPDEIHIWRAPLALPPPSLAVLAGALSRDELARAQRFRKPIDRDRFIAARGWLRQLLAGYLDADPSELTFSHTAGGKPVLAGAVAPWLHFNLSHSAGVVVFAAAEGREVGVDIERIRHDFPVESVSRRFFTAQEQQLLALTQSRTALVEAFFAIWTKKEAYLKGTGIGFGALELDLEARVPPGKLAEKDESVHSPQAGQDWTVTAFYAGAGYAAGVAAEGGPVRVPAAAQELSLIPL